MVAFLCQSTMQMLLAESASQKMLRNTTAFQTPTIFRPCLKQSVKEAVSTCRRRPVIAQAYADARTTTGPIWEQIGGCDVVLPNADAATNAPAAVVHFAGGFGAGIAPRAMYAPLLEEIASLASVVIVATPVGTSFDHMRVAKEVAVKSNEAIEVLRMRWQVPWVPVFGIGHSLGSKVHLLANSDNAMRATMGPRVANMLIAFNNYSAARSIPMWGTLRSTIASGATSIPPELSNIFKTVVNAANSSGDIFGGLPPEVMSWVAKAGVAASELTAGLERGDFTPSSEEFMRLVSSGYSVDRNLIISYTQDTLDCSRELIPVLQDRFSEKNVVIRTLSGTHVTPLTPELDSSRMQSTGFEQVDGAVKSAADSARRQLYDTVTIIVAYLRLNLEVLAEKRRLPAS